MAAAARTVERVTATIASVTRVMTMGTWSRRRAPLQLMARFIASEVVRHLSSVVETKGTSTKWAQFGSGGDIVNRGLSVLAVVGFGRTTRSLPPLAEDWLLGIF